MNSRDRYAQIIRDLRAAELYGIRISTMLFPF